MTSHPDSKHTASYNSLAIVLCDTVWLIAELIYDRIDITRYNNTCSVNFCYFYNTTEFKYSKLNWNRNIYIVHNLRFVNELFLRRSYVLLLEIIFQRENLFSVQFEWIFIQLTLDEVFQLLLIRDSISLLRTVLRSFLLVFPRGITYIFIRYYL